MKAVIVGDAEVTKQFRSMPNTVREELRKEVKDLSLQLRGYVVKDKLSGQVLHRRTGTLSRKTNSRVEETPGNITGIVGTKVSYAAVHEFGGNVTVKEHLRTIKQAFGNSLKAPVTFIVKAHKAKYPARSFLRSALSDFRGKIMAGLESAFRRGINKR